MRYKKFLIFISSVFLVLLFIYMYLPGYARYNELLAKEKGLKNQIKNLKFKNQEMENELKLLKTDVTYLEKVMRNELGLVKPGEIVYKVVEQKNTESTRLEQ